jgi:hypothetical protein
MATVREMKAMTEIEPGDVCSRCGATVRPPVAPDGLLEGGVDVLASHSVIEGSLEGGVDIGPWWECDCLGSDGPQVPDR